MTVAPDEQGRAGTSVTPALLRFYDGRARDLRAAAQAVALQRLFLAPLAAVRLLLLCLLAAEVARPRR
jgi:hypothetical protein